MTNVWTDADLEAGRQAMVGGGVGAAIAILVDHARGASLWDSNGKEYIDCTSQA